ncbi:fetal and adult testis-expressed transcript protein [Physeter macrocephalus]|uniref:Fetal and adult testis-expressed transcript protein n=1 Tax=Physeter macrocephalus TaxID=9755 RepID=A0A455B238_PHYMC|nr:fetal and adult testis-expressed transcript protein [Physeter catodon]|eukprot:XP_028338146.1 fetal and adult testis-expressed transcript protein [Physeter catodon]
MAGGPPNIKEDTEMSMAEALAPGSQGHKRKEHGSQSLGASQRQQKLVLKAAGSAAVWNMAATWSQKVVVNPGADMVAEIGLGELNGLEMEVTRRQLHVMAGRPRAVEDQGATRRHRGAAPSAVLLSPCWSPFLPFFSSLPRPPQPILLPALSSTRAISQLCLREALAAGRWRTCGIPEV